MRIRNPLLRELHVAALLFDANPGATFDLRGNRRRAAAQEAIKHDIARVGQESNGSAR